jgi:hypothetical protein
VGISNEVSIICAGNIHRRVPTFEIGDRCITFVPEPLIESFYEAIFRAFSSKPG